MDYRLPDSSVRGIFPGKNTGVGCHFLLQGIFPTQGSNTRLLHLLDWEADSTIMPQGSPTPVSMLSLGELMGIMPRPLHRRGSWGSRGEEAEPCAFREQWGPRGARGPPAPSRAHSSSRTSNTSSHACPQKRVTCL